MAKKHSKPNLGALPRDSATSLVKQSIKQDRTNVYTGSHHSKRERRMVQKWRERNPTDSRDFVSALKQAKFERGAPLRNFGRASLDGFSSTYGITRIFAFCFGILLLSSLIGALVGTSNDRTFAGFLEWLPSVKSVPLNWLTIDSFTVPYYDFNIDFFLVEWAEAVFNFFVELVNSITIYLDTPLRIITWLATALINVALFILQFAGWLFAGI